MKSCYYGGYRFIDASFEFGWVGTCDHVFQALFVDTFSQYGGRNRLLRHHLRDEG